MRKATKVHENMLIIANYQRNVYQNYNEFTTSHQSEWPSLKSLQITNAGEGVEEKEPSHTVAGNVHWYNHCGTII